jgi:hypothetical protein
MLVENLTVSSGLHRGSAPQAPALVQTTKGERVWKTGFSVAARPHGATVVHGQFSRALIQRVWVAAD